MLAFNLSGILSAKPQFMIVISQGTDMKDPATSACINWLEHCVWDGFKKQLPCADVNMMSGIEAMLNFGRQQALLGTQNAVTMDDISGAMGVEYMILISATILTNSVVCKATCFNMRKKASIAEGFLQAQGSDFIECGSQVADMMIKELVKYEICPYTGSINVQVKTESSTKKTDSYPVYCNGKDGLYKLVSNSNKNSDVNWKFTKLKKNRTDGTVTYNLYEDSDIEEQNDCFKCPSGREGSRMYTERITQTVVIEGLSKESSFEGEQVSDAYCQLVFEDNDTYFLQVKSASKKGNRKVKTTQKAEGTCGNMNPPPKNETLENNVDISIKERFGPFQGTSEEKVLSQKQTITRIDPLTKEKTTISFDFNLKRD
jgi:hypothetical protein